MSNQLRFVAITCDDVERAKAFYEAVFGWRFEDWGPPGFYVTRDSGVSCALQERHEPIVGTHPRSFEITIGVDDLDAIAANVAAAGGVVVMTGMHIETVGTLMHFTDSEGNRVGAMKYDTPQG